MPPALVWASSSSTSHVQEVEIAWHLLSLSLPSILESMIFESSQVQPIIFVPHHADPVAHPVYHESPVSARFCGSNVLFCFVLFCQLETSAQGNKMAKVRSQSDGFSSSWQNFSIVQTSRFKFSRLVADPDNPSRFWSFGSSTPLMPSESSFDHAIYPALGKDSIVLKGIL